MGGDVTVASEPGKGKCSTYSPHPYERRTSSSTPRSIAIKISGLRRQIDIVHKQCVNASLAECDNRVGGRADNWLAVVEGRIDDDRHSRSCKKAGYKIVKARI